jgi:hypothetical protein
MKNFTVLGLVTVVFAAVSIATACGGDDEGSGGSGNTTNTGAGTSTGGNAGGGGGGVGGDNTMCKDIDGAMTCNSPDPAHDNAMFSIDGATAVIAGTDGSPAAAITTKVCGTNICSDIGQTDASGNAVVDSQGLGFIDPRFVYGGGKTHGEFAVMLDANDMNPAFGPVHAVTLPTFAEGVPMLPGMDVTSDGVTLSIPADADIDFDCLVYTDQSQLGWRANAVDAGQFNFPAVDTSGLNIEIVVALAPINTVVCPAAPLTVPNVAGWNANDAVDFYIHGHLTFNHYAPYGGWALVATGVVSADGATITTDAGQGIELLATYGLVRQ